MKPLADMACVMQCFEYYVAACSLGLQILVDFKNSAFSGY